MCCLSPFSSFNDEKQGSSITILSIHLFKLFLTHDNNNVQSHYQQEGKLSNSSKPRYYHSTTLSLITSDVMLVTSLFYLLHLNISKLCQIF